MSTKASIKKISGAKAILETARKCDIGLISGVPGFPITSLMDSFMEDSEFSDKSFWTTNEKVAFEMALGASVTGTRALVLNKHVGMNVLCDPLVSSTTHTIGTGIVIIAGDDPGIAASQNEQDSRNFGTLAEVAVFDPANPQDAATALSDAFRISEETRSVAIIRTTSRMLESLQEVELPDSSESKNTYDLSIWDYTMKGKHQLFHSKSYPYLVSESEKLAVSILSENKGKLGIISSGYVSTIVDGVVREKQIECSHLALNMVNPFPFEAIRDFIDKHESILVAEETETFLESHISIESKVKGKLTGHLPYGIIEADDIDQAITKIDKKEIKPNRFIETIASRGPRPLCDDCPYLPLYRVLGKMDVPVAGDIGCLIRSAPAPLRAVQTGFALGSSISVASGFSNKGISVIGDFGLAHFGIVGLINAVHLESDILIFVLKNRVAAMTGGQEAPDLTNIVEQMVEDVITINADNEDEEVLRELIRNKLSKKGISVIFLEGKCTKYCDSEEM
ncbi:indolepyruvate ferredoxin oxidoreductase alpha subunit [Methanohalophilus levihalophilus]|uniref:thiamine pyrophosphate-dependent enzyme n=1 Tax=Methanohalophilus levihalophilus TaxID=1431282 RepID=UPI001AE23074|nr:thiamine pyrophosphate-dependent enzyme [Methanohalophilus levihalophilus]MBP2029426.1 indolepyruvate ferredoxin oxidoreductase alpha subunit [Methanohalophilus levihalophilus]